jgi:hypothetical protein
MAKKTLSLVLCLVLLVSGVGFAYAVGDSIVVNDETLFIDHDGYEELSTELFSFFEDFFGILETGDISTFEEAVSDTNTYLLLKDMVYKHDFYDVFHDGISDVNINQFLIKEVEYTPAQTNVIVYVSARYTFNGSESTSIGSLYRVNLVDDTVVAIDTTSVENQMLKDTLKVVKSKARSGENVFSSANDFTMIDNIFSEKTANLLPEKQLADEMQQTVIQSENDLGQSADTSTMSLAATVSYNAADARYYGFWFGDHYENYIFHRATLDCTNFVSQCIWAGYGGASGYAITDIGSTATASNSTAVALKQRVAADYRQVSGSTGWYGRNYDSTLGDPVSSFCGVPNLWTWTTSNTGNGPRATGYNDGNLYCKMRLLRFGSTTFSS